LRDPHLGDSAPVGNTATTERAVSRAGYSGSVATGDLRFHGSPSPQPSPARGEGVCLCSMPVLNTLDSVGRMTPYSRPAQFCPSPLTGEGWGEGGHRRARKNAVNNAPHSSASTPPSTCTLWFNHG